jgi:hypothetical protein
MSVARVKDFTPEAVNKFLQHFSASDAVYKLFSTCDETGLTVVQRKVSEVIEGQMAG